MSAEIWVFDAVSKVNRVVIRGPGIVDTPVWSADSTRLLYARAIGGGPRLFTRGLTESDREQAIAAADFQLATDWSRDGRFALYNTENVIDGDLGVVDLESRLATPLLNTPAHETGAVFSPDGQWVAFISNASGESEAYVQGFRTGDPPSLAGERTRISKQGAQCIRWRGDGKELIYLGPDGMFYGVSIALPQLRIGTPVSLFRISVASRAVLPTVFGFDVSADGSRFLVSTVREPRGPNLVVVKDWESLLRHPVP
jgi:Tol biopolymer transport system component